MMPRRSHDKAEQPPKPAHEFEFTIIAGELKGRRILAPDLGGTRPPLSRVRKSIFDFLTPYLPEAVYLDLFSGTGSYLFEAVSRGAARGIGVEWEKTLAEAINAQARAFKVQDRLICHSDDVFKRVPALEDTLDIVMIAPPQYKRLIDRTLTMLQPLPTVTRETLILCQHDTSETKKIDFRGWHVIEHRKYGNTTFTIVRRPSA